MKDLSAIKRKVFHSDNFRYVSYQLICHRIKRIIEKQFQINKKTITILNALLHLMPQLLETAFCVKFNAENEETDKSEEAVYLINNLPWTS